LRNWGSYISESAAMVKVDVIEVKPEQHGGGNLGRRRSRRLGSTRGLRPAAGQSNGWVRVFSGLQQQQETRGTLVYLTHNTTVRDICRDLVLTEDVSIWMQVFAARVGYGISLVRN
jgi:hypothetical protein